VEESMGKIGKKTTVLSSEHRRWSRSEIQGWKMKESESQNVNILPADSKDQISRTNRY